METRRKLNTITVHRNGSDDHLELLIELVSNITVTKRECEIIRALLTMQQEGIDSDMRKSLKGYLRISRENLNNMLLRMQRKGLLDEDWKLSGEYMPLMEQVDQLVVKFN